MSQLPIHGVDLNQDLIRQSIELSEDQVRKSVGGVGNFLRMEENDESPAARDTVGHDAFFFVSLAAIGMGKMRCAP